jgi:type I restriction enzyme S subunit
MFDLYSIPAFDRGAPEVVAGKQIGSAKQIVEPGDVLLSKIVPHIRRSWVVGENRGRRLIASGEWIVFRSGRVHPQYLRHVLVGNPFHVQFMSTVSGVGGSLLRARPTHVGRIKLCLPPLPEQRRIAEILDKADALRAKRRAALAKLDTLTQSIFLDMFGDPATNPKGWPVRRIEDVAEIISGATPRTDIADYWDGDLNWVTPKDLSGLEGIYLDTTDRSITEAGLSSCAASVLPANSVLFSSRAPIGHTAICRTPMATNQGFKSFVPREGALDSHFLLHWLRLRRPYLEGLGTGATFKEVSKALVARIELGVPPHTVQVRFASNVIEIERLRKTQQSARAECDALFASLQHRAFRGEL